MIYFPCIQAQYASKCNLKGLCHRVVSTDKSIQNGRYSLVLFVDYNKLQYKYSMKNNGPIEKAFKANKIKIICTEKAYQHLEVELKAVKH